jgi:hypothetical protein
MSKLVFPQAEANATLWDIGNANESALALDKFWRRLGEEAKLAIIIKSDYGLRFQF